MKKALSSLVAIVLVFMIFLTGCGNLIGASTESEQRKDGRVQIDFWSFWGSETRRPVIEKIVDDFNKSQDKIFVKYTFIPFGDIWTKELAAVAAGNPPDVVISDLGKLKHRAQKNQVENLGPYVKNDPSIKDRFLPQAWEAVLYNNEPYALPFNLDTYMLFYNKDLFKEAGLDPDKPPKTWDEALEYSHKLDKKNGNKYERIGFYPLWDAGPDIWMVNADGEPYFDKNDKSMIADPENAEALKWIKKFNEKYGLNTIDAFKGEFGQKQSEPFISQKVAMYVKNTTFYTQIRDYGKGMNFGVAPLPERKPGSGHYSWSSGFVAEIPKGSKHVKEAYEFIKYLTDVEAQTYWGAKLFDNVANKHANDKILAQLSGEAKMVYQAAVDNLKLSVMQNMPIKAPDYDKFINPELDQALRGSKPPEKALQDAQAAVLKQMAGQ
ncbi:ABC transporter substrate-binding protein [Lihuaxuella thermophila]|uniref:Multiple sugar transport system substrate-binding protein n=1 Tax=Lihuaxuella thermophila TaxID=1173111 RepID=A0A1H8G8L7_9BACL|nr:ABC transporter substrate-binding protein [Lihuaxuella thermophila]SEN40343.1 multiple sugar transport system substrate-binding protein [Lihuaxuella thermophila]